MRGVSGGRSRRRPWPYDVVIVNGSEITGLMTVNNPTTENDTPNVQPQALSQAAPPKFNPTAANPTVEGGFEYRDFSLGMGLRMQIEDEDRRYYYARATNCMIQNQAIQGPQIKSVVLGPTTRDTTNGISHFFEIDNQLYALNGRYVLVAAAQHSIGETGGPTGGTFTLTYGGNTSAGQAFDASAATIQATLRALHTDLASVTVTRTGAVTNFTWTVVMRGAGAAPAVMTANAAGLTGGTTPAISPVAATLPDTDWYVDKDFGANNAALDVCVFHSNAGGVGNYAFFAMGLSNPIYWFDGTTYTQSVEALYSRAFCNKDHNLWSADGNNQVTMVDTDADPRVLADWTAGDSVLIGEAESPINRIVLNAAGFLVVLKTDGVYVVDDKNEGHQLYPGAKFSVLAENGKAHWVSGSFLYVNMGKGLQMFDPSMELRRNVGPEQFVDNDSPVRGYITAGLETPFADYAGLYNPDTGHSYLVANGAYIMDNQIETRISAWHGSLSDITQTSNPHSSNGNFDNKKITAMYRTSFNADTDHERVYIGCSDGKISMFQLSCVPNPVGCTHYKYYDGSQYVDDSVSEIHLPLWHGGFPHNEKNIRAATGMGSAFSVADKSYLGSLFIRSAGSGTAFTEYNSGTARIWVSAAPAARIPIDRTGTLFEMVLTLLSNNRSTTPIVNGIGLAWQVIVPPFMVRGPFYFIVEGNLLNYEGVASRLGPSALRRRVKAATENSAGVTVYEADEQSHTVILTNYQEQLPVFDRRAQRWREVVGCIGIDIDRMLTATVGESDDFHVLS